MSYILVINNDECFAPECLETIFSSDIKRPEKIFIVQRFTESESHFSRIKYQIINLVALGPRFCFDYLFLTPLRIFLKKKKSISEVLCQKNIPYTFVLSVNSKKFIEEVNGLDPECILNIASQLYKKQTLKTLNKRILNFHPGCLTNNRGRYPAFWGSYLDLKPCIVCHQISSKIDAGAVYNKLTLPVPFKNSPANLTRQYAENLPVITKHVIEDLTLGQLEKKDEVLNGVYRPAPSFSTLIRFLVFKKKYGAS